MADHCLPFSSKTVIDAGGRSNCGDSATQHMHVVIAGGGIGGLSLACFLGRTDGIAVTVVERAEDVVRSTAGNGIGLWINAQRALEQVPGLIQALRDVSAPMPVPTYCDKHGRVLARPSDSFGDRFPVLCLGRDDLMRCLLRHAAGSSSQQQQQQQMQQMQQLTNRLGEKEEEEQKEEVLGRRTASAPPSTIKLVRGVSVTNMVEEPQGVRVMLSDGRQLSADVLVAADGLRSPLRALMLREAGRTAPFTPVHMGYTYFRAVLSVDLLDDQMATTTSSTSQWHAHAFESWCDGHRFGYVPLRKPDVFWFVAIRTDHPILASFEKEPGAHGSATQVTGVSEEFKAQLLGLVSPWNAPLPLRLLVSRTPASSLIRTDIFKVPSVSSFPWSSASGRVILLGDAAHATAPNVAQGAGLSIEDAVELAAELARVAPTCKSWPEGLRIAAARYASSRVPRAQTVQFMADTIASVGQLQHPALRVARDSVMLVGTTLLPRLEQALFEASVSISLGGSRRARTWFPPAVPGSRNGEAIARAHWRSSMLGRVLGDEPFESLPQHVRDFKSSPTGGRGEGLVTVERCTNLLGRLVGGYMGLPAPMKDAPFMASVATTMSGLQKWTRVFGVGFPALQTRYSTTQDTFVPFFGGSPVLTEGIGGSFDRLARFLYNIEMREEGRELAFTSRGLMVLGLRLPLPGFLQPQSQWTERATDGGWTFDGTISLPLLGHIMHYYGNFHIEKPQLVPSERCCRVLIAGGTGMLGRRVCEQLARRGHEVIVLTRREDDCAASWSNSSYVRMVKWDAKTSKGWGGLIDKHTVLINLAGENPGARRWTRSVRTSIIESRLNAISAMQEAIQQAAARGSPPLAFLQASAAGVMGNRGDEMLDEDAPVAKPLKPACEQSGSDFRIATCVELERAALEAVKGTSTRSVSLRIGHVLSTDGGLLPHMELASLMRASRLGPGTQWVPWIHIDDAALAIVSTVEADTSSPLASGPIHICGPTPATNADMMQILSKVRGRRACLVPVFELPLRLAVGDSACVVLDSERLVPKRLMQANFTWKYPTIAETLSHLY